MQGSKITDGTVMLLMSAEDAEMLAAVLEDHSMHLAWEVERDREKGDGQASWVEDTQIASDFCWQTSVGLDKILGTMEDEEHEDEV